MAGHFILCSQSKLMDHIEERCEITSMGKESLEPILRYLKLSPGEYLRDQTGEGDLILDVS